MYEEISSPGRPQWMERFMRKCRLVLANVALICCSSHDSSFCWNVSDSAESKCSASHAECAMWVISTDSATRKLRSSCFGRSSCRHDLEANFDKIGRSSGQRRDREMRRTTQRARYERERSTVYTHNPHRYDGHASELRSWRGLLRTRDVCSAVRLPVVS